MCVKTLCTLPFSFLIRTTCRLFCHLCSCLSLYLGWVPASSEPPNIHQVGQFTHHGFNLSWIGSKYEHLYSLCATIWVISMLVVISSDLKRKSENFPCECSKTRKTDDTRHRQRQCILEHHHGSTKSRSYQYAPPQAHQTILLAMWNDILDSGFSCIVCCNGCAEICAAAMEVARDMWIHSYIHGFTTGCCCIIYYCWLFHWCGFMYIT